MDVQVDEVVRSEGHGGLMVAAPAAVPNHLVTAPGTR
jgi:hypothetical protein